MIERMLLNIKYISNKTIGVWRWSRTPERGNMRKKAIENLEALKNGYIQNVIVVTNFLNITVMDIIQFR